MGGAGIWAVQKAKEHGGDIAGKTLFRDGCAIEIGQGKASRKIGPVTSMLLKVGGVVEQAAKENERIRARLKPGRGTLIIDACCFP